MTDPSILLERAISQLQRDQKTLTQDALDTRPRRHSPIALQSVTFSQLSQENPTGCSTIREDEMLCPTLGTDTLGESDNGRGAAKGARGGGR
jgi:hypothetical protein